MTLIQWFHTWESARRTWPLDYWVGLCHVTPAGKLSITALFYPMRWWAMSLAKPVMGTGPLAGANGHETHVRTEISLCSPCFPTPHPNLELHRERLFPPFSWGSKDVSWQLLETMSPDSGKLVRWMRKEEMKMEREQETQDDGVQKSSHFEESSHLLAPQFY